MKGEKRILRMENTKNEKDFGTGIPENAIEALARVLLPEIENSTTRKKAERPLKSGNSKRKKKLHNQ